MGLSNTHESANPTDHDDPFGEIEVLPAATDRHLSDETSALTAHNLVLWGVKKDGSPYLERRLENVSFRKTSRGQVNVEGYDPVAGGMRSFDWSTVVKWQVVS